MKVKTIVFIFGKASMLTKYTDIPAYTISKWGDDVPEGYRGIVKRALKRHKRALDRKYNKVMK